MLGEGKSYVTGAANFSTISPIEALLVEIRCGERKYAVPVDFDLLLPGLYIFHKALNINLEDFQSRGTAQRGIDQNDVNPRPKPQLHVAALFGRGYE